MRFLSVFILIAACFVCSSGSVGSKSAAEQPDISKSGSNFFGNLFRYGESAERRPHPHPQRCYLSSLG